MPAKVTKLRGGGSRVKTPNAVHAKRTTKKKAEAQQRLLNAIDHGFKPTQLMNRATRGSPPFTEAELKQGFRRLG
jgi:hypothetical protein